MNPITYLCFTLMSILIQFCLMDITSEPLKLGKNTVAFNRTLKEENSNDVLKRITQKPHALYYRTETQTKKDNGLETIYPNSTITESTFITTDLVSTEIIVYEDNVSMTDDAFTTESLYTSTEYDNVTEITFLYKTSTVKPIEKKKTIKQDKCPCDLLYQMCDINCCCDSDCTEKETLLFKNCREDTLESNKDSQLNNKQNLECSNNVIENLFCVVKVNLPDKRDVRYSEADVTVINKVYKWHNIEKIPSPSDTKKTLYSTGDPLLLLKNGKLYNIDLPSVSTSNYCRGSKPIRFLVNENIGCNVKLMDLHGLQILKIAQETRIVTFPNKYNSTTLNCSTLLCTNWTVIVCNEEECQSYNKELHDPLCSDTYCSNIAYKIEYMFYCNESGVVSSTVKLYVKEVSTDLQLVTQYIHVSFLMTNHTKRIIKLSGNPGYIHSLPVIASTAESNHTHHFYNYTEEDDKYLMFPANKQGRCVLNQMMNNKMQFGHNKRTNCRLTMEWIKFSDVSDGCMKIQERISNFLRINGDIFISPYGKPPADVDWVLLKKFDNNNIRGEYRASESKLLCYNVVTRFSITIVYVDIGKNAKENKIISANVVGSPRNMTICDRVNYSVVVSIDVNFIDASAPAMRVYAGAPLLSINLPKNFFLPFY